MGSADAVWFGVDARGHVAVFRWRGDAAIPREANTALPAFGLFRALERDQARTRAIVDLRGSFWPDDDLPAGRYTLLAASPQPTLGRFHVFLRSSDPVAESIARGECRAVGSTEGVGFVFPELSKPSAKQLYHSPDLLGALPRPEVSNPHAADVIASFGLYVFEDLGGEEEEEVPYGRIALPEQPRAFELMPAQIKGVEGVVPFDLDFNDVAHLVPEK